MKTQGKEGGPNSYYIPATLIVKATQALCNDPLIFRIVVIFFSPVVPCTQPFYMRCPLFFPPPHPTPSLTSLSRNEILSLFLPDPAELVFMGGKRAPLDAAGKSIVISEHGYIREWLYQSMVISLEHGNIREW